MTQTLRSNPLVDRTKKFGLAVIVLVERLPSGRNSDIIARQLIRCGTSVGANYRSACRARSRADFISKIGIVEEEADESLYWLEVIEESGLSRNPEIKQLRQEANELVSIAASSVKTARRNSAR